MPEFSGIFVGMARYHGYLQSAEKILLTYAGAVPLAVFLKQFFAQHKQMGSRDRKAISHLCYQYYRMGNMLSQLPVKDKLVLASWMPGAGQSMVADMTRSSAEFDHLQSIFRETLANPVADLGRFPFDAGLSAGIDRQAYASSMAFQPDLFLRSRPGKEQAVQNWLHQHAISFEALEHGALRLPNATALPPDFPLDTVALVQDYSSQQTGLLLKQSLENLGIQPQRIWDACAASGGKSILLYDLLTSIELTVSDVRESILHNLQSRFQRAGIRAAHTLQADLTKPMKKVPGAPFDMVLTDVPCSGSGTWARTPEQLCFFKEESLADYAQRQLTIASQAARHIRPGGLLVYITCSVFAVENEQVVDRLAKSLHARVLMQQVIAGWQQRADSMFIAILQLS